MTGVLGQNPGTTGSEVWIIIGLGVMAMIYMAVVRPMMRRKDPLDRSPPSFPSLSQQRSVERQMQSLLVELSEMARQITAQLDTRSAKLELLMKEADEKIAALKSIGGNGYIPPPAEGASPPRPPPVQEIDPRHAEVYALADTGKDPNEIASTLGRPRGEVELILALRREG